MDDKLMFRLKEFYTLEVFQVAYYEAQVCSATDEYYRKAFEKLVRLEQGHADYFENMITQANETVPTFVGSIFQLAGNFLGETVESTGQYNTCKLGIALENRAMEMYREFILECKEKNYLIIHSSLMENLLDEEFHSLWLIDYMNKHPN
jgi:bacterioferritin